LTEVFHSFEISGILNICPVFWLNSYKEASNNPKEAEIAFERNFKDSFNNYVKSFWKILKE